MSNFPVDARAIARAACNLSSDAPVPEDLRRALSRVVGDERLLVAFRDELNVLAKVRPGPPGFAAEHAAEAEVVDTGIAELIGSRGDADRFIRALDGDPDRLRDEVRRRREVVLLAGADTLLLRGGRIAPLRLEGIAATLADLVCHPMHRAAAAFGRAFKAALLPDLVPDGAVFASEGAAAVMAVDGATRQIVRLADARVDGMRTLRVELVPGRSGWYVIRGEPVVRVTARQLPEGTFPGGVLMVVCPFGSGLRMSVGGALAVQVDDPGGDASESIGLHARIEESFAAPPRERPRLNRQGVSLVLIPQEISGPWSADD